MSATKDGLTCEKNVYARHLYLSVHPARAAVIRTEAPGAGGVGQRSDVVSAINWAERHGDCRHAIAAGVCW